MKHGIWDSGEIPITQSKQTLSPLLRNPFCSCSERAFCDIVSVKLRSFNAAILC